VHPETHHKVTTSHLKREAYLYVRQSTLRQVLENTESTKRQYALRDRAVALGWTHEQVVVIDSDLGQSGAATDREGFQKLVADVGLGRVGVVLGLEVSRLARNSVDWQRLLEICALTDTLILDEDGIYNPDHFNDRLLLGLKGTMSEAELHVLRARLRGGILNKAARGELKVRLPVGLVFGPDDKVVLDPDQQVQDAIRLVFQTFRRTGSAMATVRSLRQHHVLVPWRPHTGPHKGEIAWGEPLQWRVMNFLKNPRYAGAFVYGRRQGCKTSDHPRPNQPELPREDWLALFPDAHPGYITWAEYEENRRRLRENAQAYGSDRRKSPPREGPALLQGLAVCGVCGRRMTVHYPTSRSGQKARVEYRCAQVGIDRGEPFCQRIAGTSVDRAIADLLVEAVTPLALEVALTVQDELNARAEEIDKLRRKQVERARYEADLAQRRYLRVDPDNRLVADTLEAEWNHKLRALAEAQDDYERQRQADVLLLDGERRARVMALASDFPRLWHDPNTPARERKRLVRLIIEDVTLLRGEEITAHVRFRGGATRTLTLPRPRPAVELRKTAPAVLQELDALLDHHTDSQIANILNERGLRPGIADAFDCRIVARLRRDHAMPDHATRLRRQGLLTISEMAASLGVSIDTVKSWARAGVLPARPRNDRGEYLFERLQGEGPMKWKSVRRHGHEPVSPECVGRGAV
jgi:DNA invertase Pin-like site-specific DNA recombinase